MERVYAGVFAVVGWFAVVGQYFASHAQSVASTIDYLSYFTILSNILVAATLTAAAIAPESRIGRYLVRPPALLGTVVYITVTGLTYWLILSSLYDLHGWEYFFDRLLHYVMPPAFVLYWLVFAPKGRLPFTAALWVLVPPLIYAAYTFIHGPWTGFYPYPFVDLPKLGVWRTLRNVLDFVVFFFVTAVVYLVLERLIVRLRRPAAA